MTAVRIAGLCVAACVAILLIDYGVASWRASKDGALIKALQLQAKSDAAFSTKLAAEQKRVTASRRSRKSRDQAVAWVLIASAVLFLMYAKRLVPELAAPKPKPAPKAGKPREAKQVPRSTGAATAELDLGFIDEIVAKFGRGKEAAIPLLQAIQTHYRYLPDEALRRLCELTEITPAEIAGTSSFYGQFRRSPVGEHIARVCHGTACHVAGARHITDELRRHLAIPDGADTDPTRTFTLEEVACVGCCSLAPVLMVDAHTTGRLTPASARSALENIEQKEPA